MTSLSKKGEEVIQMNIRDFLTHLYEMGPVVVFESGNAGGGYPRNACIFNEYKETIEILFEDDSYIILPKADIQSINLRDNHISVFMTDGTRYIFEAD